MLKEGKISDGEPVNVVVPTGNFGNILAACFAKNMGLPIAKLICASNENKVLFDFFRTGVYDRNREFVLTSSPSMDILISSNLERLIYLISGCSAKKNSDLMMQLSSSGKYQISTEMREKLQDFYGGYADEAETAKTIASVYGDCGYIIDPHTAVASCVYSKYQKETKDETKTVIASTASPYKFTRSVMKALGKEDSKKDDFALADDLHELSGVKIPEAVEVIRTAPILHDTVCEKDEMADVVKRCLGL